ncbi:MAG: T9SS type A sorting domain-containing protein [Paludibacter sp.]
MRNLTLFLFLFLVNVFANATLQFDSSTFFGASAINADGSHLETGNTAAVNAWNVGALATGVNPSLITNTLSYTDANSAKYVDNSTGKAISFSAPTVTRNSVFYLSSSGITTVTYYLGFLLNVANGTAPSSTTLLMNFNNSSTGGSQYGRIYIKQATGNTGFTLSTGTGGNTSGSSSTLSYDAPHLIILKYTMATTPSVVQTAALFIDPTLGGAEGAATLTGTTNNTAVTVKGLNITQIVGLTCQMGGLRLASTWEDVAKSSSIPSVNAPTAVGAATSITASGFTANWTNAAINNATKYNISLYQGTTLISTTSTTDNSTTSLPINAALTPGLSYSYQVIAKGDGSTTTDASAVASASFVSPIPAVATAMISSTGFTATWTPTTNATSYTVNVYQGIDLLSSTNVSGQASTSQPITGLSAGLNYTFKVLTSDGYTSASSTSFTAIDPLIKENFQDWTDQSTAGAYSKTKTLYDGVSSGTFSSTSLIVASTVSIGSAGIAAGNSSPSVGRVIIAGTTSELTLPQLTSIGQVNIKASVGTDLNGYKLQVYDAGTSNWSDIANSTTQCSKTITKLFSYNLTYSTPTQIRVLASSGGGVNLWDLQVNPYFTTVPTQLSAPTVGLATLPTASGFTANWTAVSNALGYYVMVYNSSTLVNTSYANGQATSSLAVTGLTSSTTYTYKVLARGDGMTNYSSSNPSEISTEVTSSGPSIVQLSAPVIGNATNVASSGFTANWTSVSNALGYTVKVYWGTTFVDSTNLSGQRTSSASIIKLIPNLSYTYQVIARGNGADFTDSELSTPSATFTLLTAVIPTNTLKIILKLDDLGVLNSVFAAAPVWDYLSANKIKWGAGAIANRFDNSSSAVLSPYLNTVNEVGDTLIEVWNHGYDHSSNSSTGIYEFSGASYADQKLHFENATAAIKTYLGVQMHSFGTPYNASDAITNTVIGENSNYKVMMFSDVKSVTNGITYLDNRVNMESATGNPEYSYFVTNYYANKNTYSNYMILQGHPNYYLSGSSNLEQLKLIVQFLISEGVEFVRPYDYYRSLTLTSPTNLNTTPVSSARIDLSWTDNSSTESSFKIERSTNGTNWTFIGTSPANSTTYSDTNVPGKGTYLYRVYASCGMKSDYSNVKETNNLSTRNSELSNQNDFKINVFPNPCIDKATVQFSLSAADKVYCNIYNANGKLQMHLTESQLPAGNNQLNIDVTNFQSGVYFCQLITSHGNTIEKLTIIK